LWREFNQGALGAPDFTSQDIPILDTDYYTAEMGPKLLKRYLSFPRHQPPGQLVDLKLFAMDLERQYLIDGKRRLNLDPGYVFSGGLVLSTGKFSGHRLYLGGGGVWGELTLIYHNKAFQKLPWSYKDYLKPEIIALLEKMRRAYFLHEKENMAAMANNLE
jgi:hypothetical protein